MAGFPVGQRTPDYAHCRQYEVKKVAEGRFKFCEPQAGTRFGAPKQRPGAVRPVVHDTVIATLDHFLRPAVTADCALRAARYIEFRQSKFGVPTVIQELAVPIEYAFSNSHYSFSEYADFCLKLISIVGNIAKWFQFDLTSSLMSVL